MTTNHALPDIAYRADRQPTDPAPVTDHLTIEQRLSRLEARLERMERHAHHIQTPYVTSEPISPQGENGTNHDR